jgi:NAD(P)-dependent dehydrogenase (short-subunit alcohol dehydrogenase family)
MDNSVVLVTGACGDIGRAIALAFARTGARLVLNDLVPEQTAGPLIDAIQTAGGEAAYFAADVTNRAVVERLVESAVKLYGPPDICIGNAGIVEVSPFLDIDPASWNRQLDVNLTGCFHIGQAAARAMVKAERRGKIIFVSSWVQDVPSDGIAPYCVSKSGLKLLSKCMALELARYGIRVNVIAPGFVDAGLSGRLFREDPGLRARSEKLVPLGYIASAGDVAASVMLLCSPAADYVTGTTLLVDGGNSLFYASRRFEQEH